MTTYQFNRDAKIDDDITNKLTKDHLKIHNDLCPLEAYPHQYNELPFKAIKFKGREVIPLEPIQNDIQEEPRTQGARVGGSIKDTEQKELESNIHEEGIKLTLQQEKVFEYAPNKYKYITGMSRRVVKDKYNFTHIIADVYEPVEGATTTEMEKELNEFGLTSNPKLDPYVPTSMQSILADGLMAVQKKWVEYEGTEKSRATDFMNIYTRVARIGKAVKLSKGKSEYITTQVLNLVTTDPFQKVFPMLTEDAKRWCEKNNIVDIPKKIKYFIRSYDMSSKAIVDSVKYAHKHPKEEVRIIVTAGVLGGSPQSQYDLRIDKFKKEFDIILNSFQSVAFDNAPQTLKNLKLYGAIPSVGSIHDTHKLCFYTDDDIEVTRDYWEEGTDPETVNYYQK